MKKLLIYIVIAGTTLLTSSCNDWLDVLCRVEESDKKELIIKSEFGEFKY